MIKWIEKEIKLIYKNIIHKKIKLGIRPNPINFYLIKNLLTKPKYISNFSKLKNEIKRTIIELLYKKEKQNKVLNSYLIFFLKEEDEKEFNYYFQKIRYYKNEIINIKKKKKQKLLQK